ncbi:hypothetical protein BH20VER1_BH20VER1_18700 [soil metagenome]
MTELKSLGWSCTSIALQDLDRLQLASLCNAGGETDLARGGTSVSDDDVSFISCGAERQSRFGQDHSSGSLGRVPAPVVAGKLHGRNYGANDWGNVECWLRASAVSTTL